MYGDRAPGAPPIQVGIETRPLEHPFTGMYGDRPLEHPHTARYGDQAPGPPRIQVGMGTGPLEQPNTEQVRFRVLTRQLTDVTCPPVGSGRYYLSANIALSGIYCGQATRPSFPDPLLPSPTPNHPHPSMCHLHAFPLLFLPLSIYQRTWN